MSVLSPEGFESLADTIDVRGVSVYKMESIIEHLCRAVAGLQRKAAYSELPTLKTEMRVDVERERLAALRDRIDSMKKRRPA